MKYKIIAVGKVNEKYFKEAIDEYVKRTQRFAKVEIVEIKESLFLGNPSQSQIDKILENEAQSILKSLEGFVVGMDINGKSLSSEQIANTIDRALQTNSTICFVVGSSFGLSKTVKDSCSLLWSLGAVTLPHQLARVVLCEQIYRASTILNNTKYHK